MIKIHNDIPISTFLALSFVLIFLMFNANVISAVPCNKTIKDVFLSNFVHLDTAHLISNLYALYALSRVEKQMGYKSFIWLFIFILLLNTLLEFVVKKMFSNVNCSIGFSGVLFGLMTWEITSNNEVDIQIILAIIATVLSSSFGKNNISLVGHFIGAISGIIGSSLWKYINTKSFV